MRHYPKTPEQEDANAKAGAFCLFFGMAVVFLLKTCYAPN